MSRLQHRPRRHRTDHARVAGSHTRRLTNVTTPADPVHPVHEVRVEHGGVYVLSHLPQDRATTYVGANLHRLRRAAEEVRNLLPPHYRLRVTAALVIPTYGAHADGLDLTADVHGVLVLDAASLTNAVRRAAPAFSTSELSAVEGLLRRQLSPANTPRTATRRRTPHLPRMRSPRVLVRNA